MNILGGTYKNKKLLMPTGDKNLRPTKSIVRQAAINMLNSRIDFSTANIVDICCGIGALGLEILSRGAKHVTFVDINTKWIKQNIELLGVAEPTNIIQKDMNNLAPQQPFDIIISDPPYGKDMPNTLLTNKSLGKTGSFWLIEAETGYIPKFSKSDFELLKEKRFGKSTLFLFLQS
jgi:16S rRNA (guanine966-N2)-methyltransferase